MTKAQSSKQYDLEDRTLLFAKRTKIFIKKLPKGLVNFKNTDQLIDSSGSVGANYIEANEALSKKDFSYRIKICRKEAKESRFWLNLIDTNSITDLETERRCLVEEATELTKIFGAILEKSK